jgi:hypothetical protein
MGILMPALARVRQIAFRMVCGTNLSGLGKAMLIYSNDYEDELPRAGGTGSTWATTIPDWQAGNRFGAYGLAADGSGGTASITSCFYLLVKYAEVTPKSFVCKGDSGTSEFKPADPPHNAGNRDLIDLWDFGTDPTWGATHHCSYSYHMPFGLYALTTSSEPGMAVAADRNPWIESPAAAAKDPAGPPRFLPTNPWIESPAAAAKDPAGPPRFLPTGGTDAIKTGNAIPHQEDGQNVLFLDSHVYFEKRSFCGINDDNIYTFWDGGDPRDGTTGGMPVLGSEPQGRLDSLLVHDGQGTGGGGGGGGGGKGGRGCFLADTPVWVNGELVQISKVAPGQTVGKLLCTTPTPCLEQVERLDVHEGTFECRDITLENGNVISVADLHFFLLDSGQWVPVQELKSGSKLVSSDGSIAIKSIVKRTVPVVGKVYNLKVKNGEQYLVGQDGVVVRDW